ncbi:hypothetical protein [Cohnella phaseoli]|uniref:Uncharacterized protein n=1 Tax=Cohnella phaseoli TaxID=456490 RepID=A0A3D9JPS0_9BACL|nr:hypothetical protein [Cohnella phaseoli]RED75960.1 hypothetical protein DFP98_11320 [Cohnella phaseoli]
MNTKFYSNVQLQNGKPAELMATFNAPSYDHLQVDVETKGTVVLNTVFGIVTLSIIPYGTGESGGCIDIKYHGEKFRTTMIGFKGHRDERVKDADLYSFDLQKANS